MENSHFLHILHIPLPPSDTTKYIIQIKHTTSTNIPITLFDEIIPFAPKTGGYIDTILVYIIRE